MKSIDLKRFIKELCARQGEEARVARNAQRLRTEFPGKFDSWVVQRGRALGGKIVFGPSAVKQYSDISALKMKLEIGFLKAAEMYFNPQIAQHLLSGKSAQLLREQNASKVAHHAIKSSISALDAHSFDRNEARNIAKALSGLGSRGLLLLAEQLYTMSHEVLTGEEGKKREEFLCTFLDGKVPYIKRTRNGVYSLRIANPPSDGRLIVSKERVLLEFEHRLSPEAIDKISHSQDLKRLLKLQVQKAFGRTRWDPELIEIEERSILFQGEMEFARFTDDQIKRNIAKLCPKDDLDF